MAMILIAVLLPLLAQVTAAEKTSSEGCPRALVGENGTYNLQTYGDWCYQFVLFKQKYYSDANRECQKYGGTLAMPKTADVNNFLKKTVYDWYDFTSPVWIGIHDKKKEGKFVWEDEEKMTWHNFAAKNGPEHRNAISKAEDCVALKPETGLWHDYRCKKGVFTTVLSRFRKFKLSKKSFICQYKKI